MENELIENSNFIMYTTDDGQVEIEVRLEDENVWLTQKAMAELFDMTRNNITMHIKNIFEEKELEENSVSKNSLLTAADGKNYKTKYYNLDLIIAVGYRVKSVRGTQFRIWANKLIREYLIKGYNLNVNRFKNNGGGVYFEEVLEKIRDIRSSEYVDNENVGYLIGYEKNSGFYCWVVAVEEKYRRMGILTKMMNIFENRAKQLGYGEIILKTLNDKREMLSYLVKNKWNFIDIIKNKNVIQNEIIAEKKIL